MPHSLTATGIYITWRVRVLILADSHRPTRSRPGWRLCLCLQLSITYLLGHQAVTFALCRRYLLCSWILKAAYFKHSCGIRDTVSCLIHAFPECHEMSQVVIQTLGDKEASMQDVDTRRCKTFSNSHRVTSNCMRFAKAWFGKLL